MRRRIAISAVALLVLTVAPLAAQDVTCDDIVFDHAAMTVYPQVAEACLGVVVAEGGERYVVMKALVRQPAVVKTVGLAFQHRDGTWGDPQSITVSDDFRVVVGGEAKNVRDLTRGEEINVFLREGRWTVAMTDLDVMELPEEYHAEVVSEPVPDQGGADAAVAEAAAAMGDDGTDVATEAAGDAEMENDVAEEADAMAQADAPAQEAPATGGLSWFWIGILLAAIVVVFIVITRRKNKEG